MNKTVKIYGKVINIWKHIEEINGREIDVVTQREIEYTEYDLDGDIVVVGTEDFSAERYKNELVWCQVYTWDGKKRNKGGHRWFDYERDVRILKNQRKLVKEYLNKVYAKSEIVQLRTI